MLGRSISHFRILAKIGEGGMGVVYKAEDEKLGRPVALKILPADLAGDEERRLRLIREARTAAAVNHPNIAAIYEIDEADGVTFVAMELVEGKTLRALLSGRPMTIKEALRIATAIAEGLARALVPPPDEPDGSPHELPRIAAKWGAIHRNRCSEPTCTAANQAIFSAALAENEHVPVAGC